MYKMTFAENNSILEIEGWTLSYPLSQQHDEAKLDLSDCIKIKLFDPAGDFDQIF